MRRCFIPTVSLAVCLALCLATCARGAENILKLVPDSALGFALVQRPADADAKLQRLAEQLGLPAQSVLARLKDRAGVGEGLDGQGTLGLVVLPPKGSEVRPVAVLLVPVTDYEKFLEPLKPEDAGGGIHKIALGRGEFVARHLGGYAALAQARHRESLEEGLSVSAEVPAGLAPWQEWLAANDAAGVVLQPGIKLLSSKVRTAINTVKSALIVAGEQGKAAAAAMDVYLRLFEFAEKEVSVVAVGARLDSQGVLHIAKRARAVPGGRFAKMLTEAKPLTEGLLTGLPDRPFVVAGGAAVSEAGWDELMRFSIGMMKATRDFYGVSEEQIQKMQSLPIGWMRQARTMAVALGAGEGNEPLYSNMLAVFRTDDATAFLANYEKYLTQYGEIAKGSSSLMLPAIEIEKTKLADAPALQITARMKTPPGMPNPKQFDQLMEAMFGPGGKLVAWLAVADEHTVMVGYTHKAHLERAIQALKQGKPGLGAQADVVKTAGLLPKDATIVVYLSPRGMLAFFQRMIAAVAPPQAAAKIQVPEFPATPPVGLAVSTAPGELRGELVVPSEVLKGVGQVVRKAKDRAPR
ncbi:MAG: hypothetical protein NUV77_08075 [Thermoguttaceae bacterium]|jgi:hypothetical protein|nr:hypothetical protein [Thermoguttaceae bacterium]